METPPESSPPPRKRGFPIVAIGGLGAVVAGLGAAWMLLGQGGGTERAPPASEGGLVIDALYGGNNARWINHACEPNCEAEEIEGRVFIKALRDLTPGEELFYDYGLVLEERHTAKVKKQFACWCGAATCRGTMLAPKRR